MSEKVLATDLLQVRQLRKYFAARRGRLRREVIQIKAVDDVTFSVKSGETLGLVGESGCGKTTVGRCLTRFYVPTGGEICYNSGKEAGVDLAKLSSKELKPLWRDIRMIFQDPYASLNPRMTVFDIVAAPLRHQRMANGNELHDRVAQLLRQVGLEPEYMRRYPHAFSGGQRQRIGIARALATNPRLIIADEAVSALDVSVRAQILNIMQDLQQEFGLTYLFISHDLAVVQYIADRVIVMYVGKIVEMGPTNRLYTAPKHPYTEALLSAVPKPDPLRKSQRIILEGDVPDPAHPPSGCYFHTRCKYAEAKCSQEEPELRQVGDQMVRCHFAEQLELSGVATDEFATSEP